MRPLYHHIYLLNPPGTNRLFRDLSHLVASRFSVAGRHEPLRSKWSIKWSMWSMWSMSKIRCPVIGDGGRTREWTNGDQHDHLRQGSVETSSARGQSEARLTREEPQNPPLKKWWILGNPLGSNWFQHVPTYLRGSFGHLLMDSSLHRIERTPRGFSAIVRI